MNKYLKGETRNIFWNTIGTTANTVNSLLFLVIVTRISGTTQAGIFSFAYAVACLMFAIAIYGGRIYYVTDVKNEYESNDYLVFKVTTCVLAIVVSVLFAIINRYDAYKAMVIVLLCVFKTIEAFADYFHGIMQKKEHLYAVGKSTFFKSLLGVIVFCLTQWISGNLIYSTIALLFVNILFFIFYELKVSNKLEKVKLGFDKKKVISLFKACFYVFAISFFSMYVINIPRYFIDRMLSEDLQAIFGIIIMPATTMALIGQFIIQPIIVKVSKMYSKKNIKGIVKMAAVMVGMVITVAIVCEIGIYLLGIPVINFVYGIDISEYRIALVLLILGGTFSTLYAIFSAILTTMRRTKSQFVISLVNSIIAVGISYFFIKQFGFNGGVFSYLSIMILQFIGYGIIMVFAFKQERGVLNEKGINNNSSI